MALYECTRFPNLRNSAKIQTAPASRSLFDLNAPRDILYLAWSYLLKGHAGEDQEVSFFSDNGVVKVDVVEWRILDHGEIQIPTSSRGKSTGVYFDKVKGRNSMFITNL